MASPHSVAIALGSNRYHGRFGAPRQVVEAAISALEHGGVALVARSPIIVTDPLGPSDRQFANAVIKGRWAGTPEELLRLCKAIERDFGRRKGRRWGARVIDLDVIAVDGIIVRQRNFTLPHPAMQARMFVLDPMAKVWPDWRHPILGRTVRQLAATRRKSENRPKNRPT